MSLLSYDEVSRLLKKCDGEILPVKQVMDLMELGCNGSVSLRFYELLEKGHLAPASYSGGEIRSVRVVFPKGLSLREIELSHGLPMGSLRRRICDLYTESSMRKSRLGVGSGVLRDLKDHQYVRCVTECSCEMVEIGKRGRRFVENRPF